MKIPSFDILLTKTRPYHGVLLFFVVLLGSHFLWKWLVDADPNGQQIAIMGNDCTLFFYRLSQKTAFVSHLILQVLGSDMELHDTVLRRPTQSGVNIIWGCTAVKQIYIFMAILLLSRGPWKKKLWFIPLGMVILIVFNLLRIIFIAWITGVHPQWFDFNHELFRFLYYGLIFLLWVIWEEKIIIPKHHQ